MENKDDKRPLFKGDGVAIWIKETRNKQPYARVCLFGSIWVTAWLNTKQDYEERKKPKTQEEILGVSE